VTTGTSTITVCPAEELRAGETRLIEADGRKIGVFRGADGGLYAIEDRCSHDDGPLAEGDFDVEEAVAICPRHGSKFDIKTGRALTLPAYEPVDTFEVFVEDGLIKVKVT
jgi:3-phenylpropionate/trans-cinnamate dioxygenase ferredoxin subunit